MKPGGYPNYAHDLSQCGIVFALGLGQPYLSRVNMFAFTDGKLESDRIRYKKSVEI